jgi:hypothetical protein
MKIVITILILCFTTINTFGQCCSAGSPVGGDGSNDGLGKNELRIFASYRYSLSKVYFHNDSKLDLNFIDKSNFDFGSLSITYGIWPRLSLHTELGYFIDKTQNLNINNEKVMIRTHGLGDLAFNVRVLALRTVKPVSQLVVSAGIKIPIGAFHEEINGATVPISLQPSSGALKYNAGVFYTRKRTDRKFGCNTFALFEISQTIKKGYLIYRYGNYFQFAFAGTYAITKNFGFNANAKFEWRGKDMRESGIKIESTGSYVVFFNPQLIYNFKYKWGLILMADIPVYKYVNGYQLTNRFALQFGLRKSFSFCKKIKQS